MLSRNLVTTSIVINRSGTDSSSRAAINSGGGSPFLAGAARPIAAIASARTIASRSSSIRVNTTMSGSGSISPDGLSVIAIEPNAFTAVDRTAASGSSRARKSAAIAVLTSASFTPRNAGAQAAGPSAAHRLQPDGAIGVLQTGNERRDREAPIVRSMPNELLDCVHSIGWSGRGLQGASRSHRLPMSLIVDCLPDPDKHTATGGHGDCGCQPGPDIEPGRLPRPQIGAVIGARRCTLAALTHPIGSHGRSISS